MPAWLSSVRVRVAMAAVIAVAIAFPFMRWALMAQVHRALQSPPYGAEAAAEYLPGGERDLGGQ